MLIGIVEATNPVRLADGRIKLQVKFSHPGPDPVSFIADPADTEPHGRFLHAQAEAGFYGAITPYVAPAFDIDTVIQGRLASLAARRYQAESVGVTVSGILHRTDRESQAMLSAAFTALNANFIASTEWKGANGWATVTLAELEPVAEAVAQHVAACFANERTHADALVMLGSSLEAEILAETKTPEEATAEIEGYDIEAGWPA